MIYYQYIFYKTYMFFFKMNPRDMPGVKSILLIGFMLLVNTVLLTSLSAQLLGYDASRVAGTFSAKLCLVGCQLVFWFINYKLFWDNNRLVSTLEQFEVDSISFNKTIASFSVAIFFLLPILLLLFNIIKGAHAYENHG